MKINELKLTTYNPRKISSEQLKSLKQSLEEFGDLSGIVANKKTGNVISGHQRIKVMPKDAEIVITKKYNKPTRTQTTAEGYVVINNERYAYREVLWTQEKEKAANIAANKHGGEWDVEKLSQLLSELSETDIDLNLTGFTDKEINELIAQLEKKNKQDDDEIPNIKIKPKTKHGDIYELGMHRILCGDSTNIEDVKKLMNSKKADLGFTSPPYWVGMEYEREKSIEEIDSFIKKICESYNFAVKKDCSRIIINTGTGFTTSFNKKKKRQTLLLIDKWANNFSNFGWNLRHIRHWIKDGQLMSLSPDADMIDQHCEFIGTFENEDGKMIDFDDVINENETNIIETFFHVDGKSHRPNKTNKNWALRGYWNDIRGNAKQTGHVAAFPVELVLRHLFLYTYRNSIVLDLFLGSGTTLIACEKTNRKCYGMEIEPQYCDLTITRYCNYTGVNKIKKNGKEILWNN